MNGNDYEEGRQKKILSKVLHNPRGNRPKLSRGTLTS